MLLAAPCLAAPRMLATTSNMRDMPCALQEGALYVMHSADAFLSPYDEMAASGDLTPTGAVSPKSGQLQGGQSSPRCLHQGGTRIGRYVAQGPGKGVL